MKAILYENSVEIRRANYPDLKMKAVDLPDGFEWKLLIEGVKPIITSLERLERSEVDNDTNNVDYPHLKQIDVVYTKVRIPDAEIISMIEQAESSANESLVNYTDRIKIMVLYMAILHRKIEGLSISAKMQAILDKVDAKAVKLWQNDTNLKAKLQELTDGLDPDINIGWTNE